MPKGSWLAVSHRAEDLNVSNQGGLCGRGARKARKKVKVSLAWHKAWFNHAQHCLPLQHKEAACLRGIHSHNFTGTSHFSVLCWGRWGSSVSEGQRLSLQSPIYLPRASSGFHQEWLAGALSSDTRDLVPCVCVRWRCSSKNISQWGTSDTAFEGCCLSLVVDLVTAASQLWMRRKLKPVFFCILSPAVRSVSKSLLSEYASAFWQV